MKNISKFNGKSIMYSKFRPDYPNELVMDMIFENTLTSNSIIADIGSGTGIMTKKLLDEGFKVFAVEPNTEMRMVAEEKLQKYKLFNSIEGSAEYTTLLKMSVDFITVAQAFHWFHVKRFQKECQRILKKNGKVAIISNERMAATSINQEIEIAYKQCCPDFNGFSNGFANSEEIYDRFFQKNYSRKIYNNPLLFDKTGFIGRHLSSSFSLTKGDRLYPNLVEALSNIFDKYSKDDVIAVPNLTKYRCGFVH
ncbi:class I SAM-dependent methyltransferase [Heyndrickxia camelliae]|nr:class I SAM-dependent methyltransferase [Heyndrickxia camelliae]